MTLQKLSWMLATFLALVSAGFDVQAQILTGSRNGPHTGPFIEPDTFNPDFQFFAPADVTDYTAHPDPNTGFYFGYDRIYMNVSRPDSVQSSFDGDFTWGNRLDMGFINDEEYGWGIVGLHVDGPNEDRVFSNQEGDPLLRFDSSRLEFIDSVNQASLSGVEINRIFKRHHFHGGGILEPFVGLKYMKFNDKMVRTSEYFTFDLSPAVPDNILDTDLLFRGYGSVENNMLGAQAGFRMFKEVGHWRLGTEMRFFCMQNWEFVEGRVESSSTSSANILLLTVPTYTSFDDQATVWGGELKVDASYQITRDLSIHVGFMMLDLGKGVGRGDLSIPDPDPILLETPNAQLVVDQQDVFIGGVTFGFEVNR
jgi:hypothetical protein